MKQVLQHLGNCNVGVVAGLGAGVAGFAVADRATVSRDVRSFFQPVHFDLQGANLLVQPIWLGLALRLLARHENRRAPARASERLGDVLSHERMLSRRDLWQLSSFAARTTALRAARAVVVPIAKTGSQRGPPLPPTVWPLPCVRQRRTSSGVWAVRIRSDQRSRVLASAELTCARTGSPAPLSRASRIRCRSDWSWVRSLGRRTAALGYSLRSRTAKPSRRQSTSRSASLRSSRIISATSCEKLISGSQPSCRRALLASPRRVSTSVGRK